ncbi:chromate efflux transporter [Hyphobacterium sp. CCMP332]|nr:chromate efflux transporter [Hyphobacterium sp. CCMP332]
MAKLRDFRYFIFLKDVLGLSLTAFGGPQAHIALFTKQFVEKRGYVTEEELLELLALCQILPGPTSTQTITAIGYKKGGATLAYLTLLVWIFPAVSIMTAAGVLISYLDENQRSMEFARFIQPMAVGFVAYAAYVISSKVINTKLGGALMVIAAVISYFIRSPWVFPILLLTGGVITAMKFQQQPKQDEKEKLNIDWKNFILYLGILILAALLGNLLAYKPLLIFENFYRNGSLIFGGGQVLIPYLHTEFVEFKHYLSSEEFLTGYGMVQALPGPVFSFSAFVGALSLRELGIGGEILGATMAALGIFLPGTFLIFFIIRFWESLKQYRVVRASLEGINAASSGLVVAAALILFEPIGVDIINIGFMDIVNLLVILITFLMLMFSKVPSPLIILTGLLAGFIF